MHTEMEEGLRFETLLVEISGCFINVPADEVDRGEIRSDAIAGSKRRASTLLILARAVA